MPTPGEAFIQAEPPGSPGRAMVKSDGSVITWEAELTQVLRSCGAIICRGSWGVDLISQWDSRARIGLRRVALRRTCGRRDLAIKQCFAE